MIHPPTIFQGFCPWPPNICFAILLETKDFFPAPVFLHLNFINQSNHWLSSDPMIALSSSKSTEEIKKIVLSTVFFWHCQEENIEFICCKKWKKKDQKSRRISAKLAFWRHSWYPTLVSALISGVGGGAGYLEMRNRQSNNHKPCFLAVLWMKHSTP